MSIKEIHKLVRDHKEYLAVLLILIITFLLCYEYILEYFSSHEVLGWDGSAHFAVTKYFSDNIFPSPYGWVYNWNLGMPWPNSYTPLFTYAISIIYLISPLPDVLTFKILFVVIALALPLFLYWAGRKLKLSVTSSFLSACSIILLLGRAPNIHADVSYFGLFENGYYTYFLSLIFLIALIGYSYRTNGLRGRRNLIIMAILMAVTILTNLHVGIVAIIVVVLGILSSSYDVRLLARRFIVVAGAALPILFSWLLVTYLSSGYTLTYSIPAVTFEEIGYSTSPLYLISLVIGIAFIPISYRSTRYRLTALLSTTALLVVVISILPISEHLKSLPWQPNRIISVIHVLIPLIHGSLIELLIRSASTNLRTLIISGLTIIVLLQGGYSPSSSSLISKKTVGEYQLLEYLVGRNERTAIEFYSENPGNTLWISNLSGIPLHSETIMGSFRESAINMPFIAPIRNSLSLQNESYGNVCWLCEYWSFPYKDNSAPNLAWGYENLDIQQHVDQLEILGVDILVLSSDYSKSRIAPLELNQIAEFEQFTVYDLDSSSKVRQVNSPVTVVYTELNTKYREVSDYDWFRFNEEWLFRGDTDNLFVLANENQIDISNDHLNFDSMVVLEYNYNDFDSAYSNIVSASETMPVFLLETVDELFYALDRFKNETNNRNITILPRTGSPRNDLAELFERTELESKPSLNLDYNLDKSSDRFDFRTAEANQRVIIDYSYYPWWQGGDQDEIYMASPARIMIVSADPEFEVNYRVPLFVMVSFVISKIYLVTIVVVTVLNKKFRLKFVSAK